MYAQLRKTYQQIRQRLPQDYQEHCADAITQKITELPCFNQAKHIAFYWPINGEINVLNLWKQALSQYKSCYFPSLNKNNTLSFIRALLKTPFQENRFGIPEPLSDCFINPNELDLVLVPLLAFDKRGTRLGMGKGFYDRTFQCTNHPFLLGVAYEFQQQTHLKRQAWDVPIQAAVTERQIYRSIQ